MKIVKTSQFGAMNGDNTMGQPDPFMDPIEKDQPPQSKTPFTPQLNDTSANQPDAQPQQPSKGIPAEETAVLVDDDIDQTIQMVVDKTLSEHASIDNDGIGGYEFWGHEENDAGTDSLELEPFTVAINISQASWLDTDPLNTPLETVRGRSSLTKPGNDDMDYPVSWEAQPSGVQTIPDPTTGQNGFYAFYEIIPVS